MKNKTWKKENGTWKMKKGELSYKRKFVCKFSQK
jgi:hypothetical protein